MSRILWFHPRFPWPPRHGGDLRTTGLIDCALSAGHEVLIVTPEGEGAPHRLKLHTSGFASRRGAGLVATKVLSRHPLRSPRTSHNERRRLALRISEFEPELAVVSEVMSWSVARDLLPGGVPFIYDSPNVESRLFAELADAASGIDKVTLWIDTRRVTLAERQLVLRAATVMAVSGDDAAALDAGGQAGSVVVQNSVPTPAQAAVPARAEPIVLFVGTLDYPPNQAAVVELMDRVMPHVRRRVGAARLQLVGRRPPTALVRRAERTPWLDLAEDVPDVGPFYRTARCVVLPIRTGSGTNLKTLEAFSYGVPVVGTPVALRGLERPEEYARVAETDQDLAAAATLLLSQPEVAARLGAAGRRHFVDHLAWTTGPGKRLDDVIRSLGARS